MVISIGIFWHFIVFYGIFGIFLEFSVLEFFIMIFLYDVANLVNINTVDVEVIRTSVREFCHLNCTGVLLNVGIFS